MIIIFFNTFARRFTRSAFTMRLRLFAGLRLTLIDWFLHRQSIFQINSSNQNFNFLRSLANVDPLTPAQAAVSKKPLVTLLSFIHRACVCRVVRFVFYACA